MQYLINIYLLVNIIMKLVASNFFHKLNYYKTSLARNPPLIKMISETSLENKKILSISPGGYKGFYVLGISKFIKENYNLTEFVFSGASAGAWNSLMLCSKHPIEDIQNKLDLSSLMKINSIPEIENQIKRVILENYKTEDFELDRLYIGVTVMEKYRLNTIIYSGFKTLEDALDCCVASSHIPFLTGGLTNTYRKTLSFDGGFSKYPYLNTTPAVLHIHPNIWNKFWNEKSLLNITDYTTLFSKNNFPFDAMIDAGYSDARKNKEQLDTIFDGKRI